MGVNCEINLHKPPNGVFAGTAGSVVSGVIRYTIDGDTVITKITATLKGLAKMIYEARRTYLDDTETYVDMECEIDPPNKNINFPKGTYEAPFRFVLPHNLPNTLAYKTFSLDHMCAVRCKINYYVSIKFARHGLLKFDKQFKKDITIVSGIIPRLPTTPTIYGGEKRPVQLFSRKLNLVNVRANIQNSVLKPGGTIEVHYEVTNQTNLIVKAVEVKLVEVYKFFIKGKLEIQRLDNDVAGTESKTGAIQSEETQDRTVTITIPSDLNSSEFSKIYSRDYFVFITIHLPRPHRNYTLELPVQIGNVLTENCGEPSFSQEEEPPPSYWEAMNEHKVDKIDMDDE